MLIHCLSVKIPIKIGAVYLSRTFSVMCANGFHPAFWKVLSLHTSRPLSWQVRRQSPFHAVYSTLSAHNSASIPPSAQPIFILCFLWHLVCACLTFSTDICASKPWYTPWVAFRLHTSRFLLTSAQRTLILQIQKTLFAVYILKWGLDSVGEMMKLSARKFMA